MRDTKLAICYFCFPVFFCCFASKRRLQRGSPGRISEAVLEPQQDRNLPFPLCSPKGASYAQRGHRVVHPQSASTWHSWLTLVAVVFIHVWSHVVHHMLSQSANPLQFSVTLVAVVWPLTLCFIIHLWCLSISSRLPCNVFGLLTSGWPANFLGPLTSSQFSMASDYFRPSLFSSTPAIPLSYLPPLIPE